MTPVIVPATDEHALAMAPRLRREDAIEAHRLELLTPIDAIRQSMALSLNSWTWLLDDRPACMFGVAGDLIGTEVMPWLLTTDDVPRNMKLFWQHSKKIVELMRATHPRLQGYCDSRYEATVRWLSRLGFSLEGPVAFGSMQLPFYRFTMGS